VPFHQDAQYWDLHHTDETASTPHTAVVWLAFTDVDESNAALRVLPGSHLHSLPHVQVEGDEHVLGQGVAPDVLDDWLNGRQGAAGQQQQQQQGGGGGCGGEVGVGAATLRLRAGEISIHDCRIAHGSPANDSDRLRCGLNMTFSATDVTGDGQVPDSATFGGAEMMAPFSHEK